MIADLHCPLCARAEISFYAKDRRRPYCICSTCSLVFVPPAWHLSRDEERAHYALHRNCIDDPHYRAFLSRLMHSLVARLTPGAQGLDFGCGPGPALAHMLREADFGVALYDSFFAPEDAVLEAHYDFICATEVVEHLHRPGWELHRLWALLPPGGWLGIMTKLLRDPCAFGSWHYKNDPTHVCFFSVDTWRWWAHQYEASLDVIGADVILLQRGR